MCAAGSALLVSGCILNPGGNGSSTGGGGSSSGGGGSGFGQPTLEVTVAGVHYGPSAPSSSSSAALVDMRDSGGFITDSTFYANVTSSTGASCAIGVTNHGADIYPIGVGTYQLTADGAVTQGTPLMPVAGETVQTPTQQLGCSGSQCDGAVLVIDQLDAQHVEGYLAATFSGQDVVCAFWLPWSSYQP